MQIDRTHLVTAVILLVAVLVVSWKYWDYVVNPWTRDGQVQAHVVLVTPRVTAPIVELPIRDNQRVSAGDLLFRIDDRTFKQQLAKGTAEEVRTKGDYDRAVELVKRGDLSQRDFDKAKAAYDEAIADKESARLDLEFTEVRAPVDGYVTNLELRIGSQAIANQPALALVDTSSYYVEGFFRENDITDVQPGDHAVVTLMTYPDTPLTGVVDSLGWGIAQADGSASRDLLPSITPTFSWIRLAQRVPVRVHLEQVPEHVKLRVGTTTSVLVKTGTAGETGDSKAVAAPAPLR